MFLIYVINVRIYVNFYSSELRDEGSYSCRVKNDAGESRVDYKLLVLVPPEIIMLDKDKNRYVKFVHFSYWNAFENNKHSPG